MAISIQCGECQSPYSVAENLLGKSIKCKNCGAVIPVAAPAAAAPAAKPLPAVQPAKLIPSVPSAKPLPAKAAKPVAVMDSDDEDEDRPAKPVRKAKRNDDDDDDSPRSKKGSGDEKKKSPMMMVLLGLFALVLLGGATVGGLFAVGVIEQEKPVTEVKIDHQPAPNNPPPVPNNTTDPAGGNPSVIPGPNPSQSGPISTPKVIETPKPVTPPTSGISRAELMRGDMDEATTETVARATVLFEGEGNNGDRWTGSGWFGFEPGLVITNAHVIGMKAPDSKPPAKLTINLYRPDPNNKARVAYYRTIPHNRIQILGVDRHNDLAILRISNETDLPTPLKIRPSAELRPRQGLTTFGFPLGGNVAGATNAKSIRDVEMSVRPTAVTSFRFDALGRPKLVQTEGGQNQGNSGGPIVDAEGYVCAVVVLGIYQGTSRTQLSMSVPTEYIFGLLAGRLDEVEFDTAYKKDGMIRIPVNAKVLDPMKRLQKVNLDYWVSDSTSEVRTPGIKKPEKAASDTDHQTIPLKYDPVKLIATGEIVVPELTPGRAYWSQGSYTNALIPNGYWAPGYRIDLNGPPVDRVPADLYAKYQNGIVRPIELSNSSDLSEYFEGEGESKEERIKRITTIKMTEGIGAGNASAGSVATLGFKYQSLDIKAQQGNQEMQSAPKNVLEILNAAVTRVQAQASVNKDGEIIAYQTDTRGVPNPTLQVYMKAFSDDVLETLKTCSIPLPNRKVNALEKWESKRTFRLFIAAGVTAEDLGGAAPQPGGVPRQPKLREVKYEQKISYTYMGIRQRLGTEEAVIRIDGVVTPAAGSREQASGFIKGYANIELATGTVVLSELDSEFEVDSSSAGQKKKVSGISTYKLSRGSSVK